ncbi:uncharacterized protein LOC124137555 [Haliotis rufescens]|uniref:uncharacterized protein LOC124137555 n=1 Tax=Haliotis rufescens TaxID=6454 RepID=UPI001EB0AA77|nr:uncharacterized protein LOC124137555 [Haliotis rufescens]
MHRMYEHCRPGIRGEAVDVRAMMRACRTGEQPPSGMWKCSGVVLEMAFFSDEKVAGGGNDSVGDYYISGTWGGGEVKFVIHYTGKYDVTYNGKYADSKVTGTCVQSNGGSSSPFELVFCGKDAKVTPRPGQWSGQLCRSGGTETFHIDFEFGDHPYKSITGRGKDDKGNFRIKGRLEGRGLRLIRHNIVYYGLMNESGTAVVGMFLDSGGCWMEGRFVLKIGGGSAVPSGGASDHPTSGVWFWFLSGRPEYRCYLQLMFVPGKFSGNGRDETGYFTLTGTWSGTTITFKKSTTSVTYTGTISPGANVISGQNPDGGTFNIAFFMEFELPEFPYQFPNKNVSNGQQCAIKLFQEIQIWLSRRRRLIQEFRLIIQKIEQAQSGSLSVQFPGDIVEVNELIIIAISLLALLSGGGAASALLLRFGKKTDMVSFTSDAFKGASKILEVYKSAADAETLKDLVEEDVISSRIIYYLIDTLWDISGVLSTHCKVDISVKRIAKGFLFQAATGIDIISFAFPDEYAAPLLTAPEFDHGKLGEIESALLECIGKIAEMNKDAMDRVGGSVGVAIQLKDIQEALEDLDDASPSVFRKCLDQCIVVLERKMEIYVSLQLKTEKYFEERETISSKLSVETVVTVEFINEVIAVLRDFNPGWCQAVEEANLQEVFAATMTKVFPAIRQKMNLMMSSYRPGGSDTPVDILEIVIVGEAAVGLPAFKRDLLFPVPTLQDVVLYQPYGCTINQSTILGIASGSFRPSCRQMSSSVDLPQSWNSLLSGQTEDVPSIYLEQAVIDEVTFTELKDLLQQFPDDVQRNRLIIPFFTASDADSLPPVPLWLLTSACSVAGMVSGVNVRVHLATSLPVPDPTPELQTLCQSQYSYAQTAMTCDIAQLHLEGINTSWLNRFMQSETLSSYFSSSSTRTRNMSFEGGVIRITTTTTTTYQG